MKPDSSSTAYSVCSSGDSRGTPRKSACEAIAAHDLGRLAAALELGHGHARVAGLEVREALVVHVVQQADDAPQLLVLAVAAGVRAHRGLDGQAVAAQRRRLDPLA